MASGADLSALVKAAGIASRVSADVQIKLDAWERLLANRRSLLLDHFGLKLLAINSLDEASYREHADAEALVIVGVWCEQRDRFCQEMSRSLAPDTIVTTHRAGQSSALADYIREAFDASVRTLDAELHEVTNEALQTLKAAIERSMGS